MSNDSEKELRTKLYRLQIRELTKHPFARPTVLISVVSLLVAFGSMAASVGWSTIRAQAAKTERDKATREMRRAQDQTESLMEIGDKLSRLCAMMNAKSSELMARANLDMKDIVIDSFVGKGSGSMGNIQSLSVLSRELFRQRSELSTLGMSPGEIERIPKVPEME